MTDKMIAVQCGPKNTMFIMVSLTCALCMGKCFVIVLRDKPFTCLSSKGRAVEDTSFDKEILAKLRDSKQKSYTP